MDGVGEHRLHVSGRGPFLREEPLVMQALQHDVFRAFPDVHADPLPLQTFRGDGRRGATTEGIQYEVAFFAAGPNDALVER